MTKILHVASPRAGRGIQWLDPRQWVLTVPHGLRYAMAHDPALTGAVLRVFLAAVPWRMRKRARQQGLRGVLKTGAVTVIQRFDSASALNVHFHSLDGGGLRSTAAARDPVLAAGKS